MLNPLNFLPSAEANYLGGWFSFFNFKRMVHGFFSLFAKECDPAVLRHSQKDFAFGVKYE